MVSITRILCPTDFSECSRRALDYAATVAGWYGAGIVLLHVATPMPVADMVPSLGVTGTALVPLTNEDRVELLDRMRTFAAEVAKAAPVEFVLWEAADARAEILAQADALRTDLIVVGSHGRSGFERALLGSVTEKVVRKASCPVLVVPPHAGERPPAVPFKRIICATDFSDSASRGLAYALDLAQQSDADLLLLHVIEMSPELQELELELEHVPSWERTAVGNLRSAAEAACLRRMRERVPPDAETYCRVHVQVVEGKAHRQIVRVAAEQEADLIVMGVHGRGAVDLLMFGSTTHGVLRSATCPVLTVRS